MPSMNQKMFGGGPQHDAAQTLSFGPLHFCTHSQLGSRQIKKIMINRMIT